MLNFRTYNIYLKNETKIYFHCPYSISIFIKMRLPEK